MMVGQGYEDGVRRHLRAEVAELRRERDSLLALIEMQARSALVNLQDLTTEEFRHGGDRPARNCLEAILRLTSGAS